MGADERIRLFCALLLPDEPLDDLVRWQAEHLRGELRTVPRAHLHVTLAFLGARPAAEVPVVVDALAAAAAAGGSVELQPARYRETRSVAMIVCDDRSGAGAALAAGVGERLEEAGVYRRERRPWLAHVTVARFRQPPRLRPGRLPEGNIRSVRCALYRSTLAPGGARYDVLATVALGGR